MGAPLLLLVYGGWINVDCVGLRRGHLSKSKVPSDCVRIFQGARIALHLSFLCATLDLKCAFFCITLVRNSSMDAQISHL